MKCNVILKDLRDHFIETKKGVAVLEKIREKQMIKFHESFEMNESKERDDWTQGHYRKVR